MAEEASKLRGLEARVAALETKFNFLLQFIRRWTEREEEKKKATISKRQKEIYPALSLSKAAQTLPTPRRPAFHIPRPSRTEPRQFQPLPIPVPQLYTLLDQEEDDYACQPEDAVLRHRIQDLLDQGVLKFRIEGVINTIGAEKDEEVDITSTKIPWEPLFHELKKRGLLPAPRAPKESTEAGTCQYHPGARDHNLQGCEEFKKEVAALTRRQTSKARMERIEEDFEKFCERKKEELGKLTPATPLEMSGPDPVVIRYATKEKVVLQTASVSAVQSSEKVPSVVIQVPQPFPYQDSKRIPLELWDEILSLLLASESHRKALLKVLNEAYVPEDITGPSFENMVTSILVTNQLTFSDDELPPEGRGHTKALYISVKTNDRIVSRVLIDNGSALNVCPLSTLEKLDIDPTRVRVNSMVVRAFDGTRREVLGEIDLPVEIGPQVYDINFQVLRIDSPYNLLLGRPWLHTAGAVPSSLHQKMKLIIGNQLVTILAEEPISIYNDGEIPYIDGCAPEEASFHSFEFVTVIHRVAAVEPRLSKAGIMVAKEFVKAGFQPGQGMDWGIPRPEGIVRWPMKPGGKELQRSSKERNGPERKMVIPHIRTTFPASAMFQVDEGDVDELALLFTEDLNVNAITTEGDSAAFPIHADQHEEIDLEDFLDEENLKGYRIEEETLDEDTWEDDDLPDLLPHLDGSTRARDPGIRDILRAWRPGISSTEPTRVRGHLVLSAEEYACWGDLARAFLDRYQCNRKAATPPAKDPDNATIAEEGEEPSRHHRQAIITTAVAEEEYAGPMVEGLSIHTIAGEEDSTTTPPTRHCQQGEGRLHAKPQTIPTSPKLTTKRNCSLDNIDNSDEEIELPNDILEALERQDEGSKPNIEELEIVNLADKGEEPREVKIGTRCAAEQKEALIALLREFHEIFAWSYQDMPGLDTDIVVHKIPLKPECKPVKQALRRMKPEVILKIKEEVEKQLKAGFLSTVTYSDWVANIVPVPKKDGKVRMCVDYRDLNRASPKDNFPLPHIDTLVDNTATNVVFSFMDGFSGYNQIKMAEEDKSKTAFITHWGTFVYDVMPFGLKNAGATYQRAMVTLFHDMIHHEIEVYVDDMIAKSRTAQDHLTDLRKLFQRLKKYQLRLNPNKCAFGVTSGKLLGFIVSGRGIEIDPAKTAREPFDKIKEYLLNPPILVPPTPGRPLILYLTVQEASMGCMLGQQDETGKKEQAIYYLSKKFTEPETRYLLVEKTCCALAWASKKLRQYMLYYTTWLVSRNGPDQAIKGQAIADYLADYPSEQLELMDSEFPDEDVMTVDEDNHGRWKLYFDGAANAVGSGIGAVLVSPKGQQTPIAVKLGFDCTNNMTEYEACIVVSQTNGEWQARDPKLIPYQRYISRLVPKFKYVTFTYTPRAHNHFADALATLASLIKLVEGDDVRPLRIETRDIPAYCVCIEECMNVEAEIDNKPWRLTDMSSYWWPSTILPSGWRHVPSRMSLKSRSPGFVKNNIICRYGMPEMLITDNASNLNNRMMDQLCQQFKIQHHNSAPYRPKMNGAVEAANKNVKKILSKMTETYKDWHEHLPYALCAYRTSVRTSVGATPYSLVYGMEAVLPVEVEIPSLRILSQTQLEEAEWASSPLYQRRIERAYNKKARPRTFQPGDLVLKKRNMALSDPRGKFAPSYEGPYVVKKAFSGGAIILADMDGEEFRSPINSDSVIKYHV
uniref:Uncharacterized protein n=1 Tax=Fagus sylvatica TaxID=28930 RepID=A0A2N9HI76_FAGSY